MVLNSWNQLYATFCAIVPLHTNYLEAILCRNCPETGFWEMTPGWLQADVVPIQSFLERDLLGIRMDFTIVFICLLTIDTNCL
jgi:hypothetical protein